MKIFHQLHMAVKILLLISLGKYFFQIVEYYISGDYVEEYMTNIAHRDIVHF